jgi:hypothetical protein
METHGPLLAGIILWFTMLSPLTVLVIGLVRAWLVGR